MFLCQLVMRANVPLQLWNATENTRRTVRVTWTNRDGSASEDNNAFLGHTFDMIGSAMGGRRSTVWYTLEATDTPSFIALDATDSISALSFVIDEGDGSAPRSEDQSGQGFFLQDLVVFSNSTCAISLNSPPAWRLAVAVRGPPLRHR